MIRLRTTPGLPEPDLHPPQVAESGDPFAGLRVVHLLARVQRGEPVRVRDLVDRLNAEYMDWSFSRQVVVDAILQLQSNWLSDYRNASGIELAEGPAGLTVTIEDTSRVDPWITRQAHRLAALCHDELRRFAVEAAETA